MSKELEQAWEMYQRKQDFDKSAGITGKLGGKAIESIGRVARPFGDRVLGSFRSIKPDFQQGWGYLSKDPNSVAPALRKGFSIDDTTGGLSRPFAPSMSSSAKRFQKLMDVDQIDDKAFEELMRQSKNMKHVFHKPKWYKDLVAKKSTGVHNRSADSIMTPFQNRDAMFVSRLSRTPEGRGALYEARNAIARGEPLDQVQRKFMARAFGSNFDDADELVKAVDRYGMTGFNADGTAWKGTDWALNNFGRRAGHAAGAGAVFGPATMLPWTLAEYGGAATAIPGAKDQAIAGAKAGVTDRLHYLNTLPMHKRFQHAWNPNHNLANMYMTDPNYSGQAHQYMFGPKKYEHVSTPGLGTMFGQMINPFIGKNYIDELINAKAHQQFQKMGSITKEAGPAGKIVTETGEAIGKAAPTFDDILAGIKKSWGAGKRTMTDADDGLSAAAKNVTKHEYPVAPDDLSRWGAIKHQVKNNPFPALMFGGMTVLPMGLAALGGRSAVQRGAYSQGRGAGQAYASNMYANSPMMKRMGMALSPQLTMHQLKKLSPELFELYRDRHLPASMR